MTPTPARGLRLGQHAWGAAKVVLQYVLFASLWILFSDAIVGALVKDPRRMTTINMMKGGVFVLLTALLLQVLVTRMAAQLADHQARQAGMARELLESELRFSTAFQMIPLPAAITRLGDGTFVTANEAWLRLFGHPREAVEGHTGEDLGLWADPGTRPGIVADLQGGARVLDREVRFLKKDGTPVTAMFAGQLLVMEGQPCLLGAVVDLTERLQADQERRRLEAEIHHAQKLESLGSLASGVAHDMNNVLAAIQTVAELLSMPQGRTAQDLQSLELITRATVRGRNLVRGLTQFVRKDLQEAESLDLNALIREEAELLDRTLLQKVRVVLALDPDLAPILGDRSALGNALMNLCVNAADAMPRGGTLTLRTRQAGEGWVEWEVEDTGEGMPPEVVARATEPFFTTKAVGKGTGLGLALVHGVAKTHGGSLHILSELGQGTIVRLRFPALALHATPALEPAEAELEGPRSLRILVVDDDELIRASLPGMLEMAGHTTVVADSGRAAISLMEHGLEVDLTILDLNMPDLGGLETLERLRGLRPHLPVLIASGYIDHASLARLAPYHRVGLLTKPYAMKELRTRFRELL